jgi:hypothetical protein
MGGSAVDLETVLVTGEQSAFMDLIRAAPATIHKPSPDALMMSLSQKKKMRQSGNELRVSHLSFIYAGRNK